MNRKRLIVAFSGPSNSGKTTVIVKIASILQDSDFKVCIIKHDPKDKAMFDREGKDSFKFSQTGADVAVVSPNKTTIFKKGTSSINELISIFEDFDYLFVEGLKTLELPRISIFRNKLDESYFAVSNALAIDETIDKKSIPKSLDVLNLNNPEEIINWIDKNAKKV
ncbi:Molybdopterin-guanine dinucleotide biosynthesis adapter protein [Aliarcobacter thereius]|uniref:Molybdopterin-guanine dinucleotide biosynthesis adapter protein n=2 Tax=Aliarcobacter thereius TaxID=544718 RepID=A0A1C0B6Z6_9BACT|nr:molybdopterin-guanine dinucleotide biosynthesis protein B [Aliarcobacter thereius]OCL86940.1 Molybdopterin-guanine dinucleotide biosynthesis adapter protein [Aliarcobacter thereius]OCL91121.1 Molybdopterin-guanine dinucleotide biosynthesis adapter protein [Aliarcobacter thereius]OCL96026.1 Molybdopterin-guanine dinucleotide biosynthesis adapter protein [Aliarcobacter thereius LMG 24486]OCL99357.1 Molybdopterin-guanine dinucleotide biosynthesis adapter protein [Aliarcobacter thereius]QBF1600